MPIYNFAHYTIYPLADMPNWDKTGATLAKRHPAPPEPPAP